MHDHLVCGSMPSFGLTCVVRCDLARVRGGRKVALLTSVGTAAWPTSRPPRTCRATLRCSTQCQPRRSRRLRARGLRVAARWIMSASNYETSTRPLCPSRNGGSTLVQTKSKRVKTAKNCGSSAQGTSPSVVIRRSNATDHLAMVQTWRPAPMPSIHHAVFSDSPNTNVKHDLKTDKLTLLLELPDMHKGESSA